MKQFKSFILFCLVLVSGLAFAQAGIVAEVSPGTYMPLQVTATGSLRTTNATAADWMYAVPTGGILTTSDVVMTSGAGAGIRNYITACQLQNASTTVATEVYLKDGGAVYLWRGYLAAGQMISVYFTTPLKGTANISTVVAAGTAGVLYANCQGFKAP